MVQALSQVMTKRAPKTSPIPMTNASARLSLVWSARMRAACLAISREVGSMRSTPSSRNQRIACESVEELSVVTRAVDDREIVAVHVLRSCDDETGSIDIRKPYEDEPGSKNTCDEKYRYRTIERIASQDVSG